MKHIVIAGGSGFLGRRLARELLARGDRVTVLGRDGTPPSNLPRGTHWQRWDAKMLGDWSAVLDGADAIVNLVGRSVDCQKTVENQRVILESRVDSCRVLGEAVRAVHKPPLVWVQSATAHIIGDPVPRDTICDESTPAGPMHEMAPRVGVAWEAAFHEAKLPLQRGIVMRISFVLGRDGGAMQRLSTLTRWGLGGTVGRGDQWMSWIHEDDLARLMIAAIDDAAYEGVYMVTAPHPVTNREFMRAMRKAYARPWSPPAMAFAVRLAARFLLDTDPELALLGRRCVPTRLLSETKFEFAYTELGPALADLTHRPVGDG